MALSDSSKRSIRTLVHALVAGLTAAPTFLPWLIHASAGTPIAAHVAVLAGLLSVWVAVVAGLLNKAEDLGLIPTWLRDEVKPVEAASSSTVNLHFHGPTTDSSAQIEAALAKVKAAMNKDSV